MFPRCISSLIFFLLVAFGFQIDSYAVIIATDDFEDYAVDELIENLNPSPGPGPHGVVTSNAGAGGTGWEDDWIVSTASHVTTDTAIFRGMFVGAGGLDYSSGNISIDGGDRHLRHVSRLTTTQIPATREFASQTGTLYLGFLFRPEDSDDDDFIQFGFSDDTVNAEASFLLDESSTDGFEIRSGTSGSTDIPNVSYDPTETYLMVLKLEKVGLDTDYTVSAYVNPDSGTETGGTNLTRFASAGVATGLSSVSQLIFRISSVEIDQVSQYDNVVIATTFEEAVQFEEIIVPEPSSLSLLLVGGIFLGIGIRRRRKD